MYPAKVNIPLTQMSQKRSRRGRPLSIAISAEKQVLPTKKPIKIMGMSEIEKENFIFKI